MNKSTLPKVLDAKFLENLKSMSAACLSEDMICALLNCTENEFVKRLGKDRVFRQAYLSGKAEVIQNCAAVVVNASQGTGAIDPNQLKAAMFYLEKHAEMWLKTNG